MTKAFSTREPVLWVLLAFLVVSVAACGSMGSAPRDVGDTIGQGYALLTTATHDVLAAYQSGVIDKAMATSFDQQLHTADATLTTARQAYAAGNTSGAQTGAAAAHAAIQAVITALTAAEKKHGS